MSQYIIPERNFPRPYHSEHDYGNTCSFDLPFIIEGLGIDLTGKDCCLIFEEVQTQKQYIIEIEEIPSYGNLYLSMSLCVGLWIGDEGEQPELIEYLACPVCGKIDIPARMPRKGPCYDCLFPEQEIDCPDCAGTGEFWSGYVCNNCNGTGKRLAWYNREESCYCVTNHYKGGYEQVG